MARSALKISNYAIAQYWADRGPRFVPFLDYPRCFACYYARDGLDGFQDESRRWANSRLERAHIVADSIGGSSTDPSNFLLLCKRCHREAPMHSKPAIMLTWARNREGWITRQLRELIDACTQYGLGIDNAPFFTRADHEPFEQFLLSIRTDSHPLSYGSEANMASFVPALAHYVAERDTRLIGLLP